MSPGQEITFSGATTGGVAPASDLPTAAAAIAGYVRRQRDRLVSREPLVRRDRPRSVQAMRIACRRLRSVWQEWHSPAGDPVVAELITDSLWLNQCLGAVRHLDVTVQRLHRGGTLTGPAGEWIGKRLRDQRATAHRELLQDLKGIRYTAFVAALDALAVPTPQVPAVRSPASLDHSRYVFGDALTRALAVPGTDDRADALHDLRKHIKQVRDVTQSLAASISCPLSRHLDRHLRTLQGHLGEHQDSTVCRQTAQELLTHAPGTAVETALRAAASREYTTVQHLETRLAACTTRPVRPA